MDMHQEQHHDHQPQGTEANGHTGHNHASMIDDFRKRFIVVLVLTIPIMLLSPMIQHWMKVQWDFTGSKYILLALSSVVFAYGG